jgi:hypothetical protein
MPICSYCGKKAGWFSDFHESCERTAKAGCEQVAAMIASIVSDKLIPAHEDDQWVKTLAEKVWAEAKPAVDQLAAQHRIPPADLRDALRKGWSTGVEHVATAEPMSPNRVAVNHQFFRAMGFTDEELKKTDGLMAQVFSTLLWSVMVHGDPTAVANVPQHPFNLKPNEVALMYFANVVYSKEIISRSRQGGYGGLSVPLGHGVYYHFGGFKSENIDTATLKEIDYGAMLIATKHIYFGGPHATFRIPYEHVVSFRSYASGIGIFRDNASAKAEVFTVLERNPYGGEPINARPLVGWLLYNMAHFLAQPNAQSYVAPH